MTEQEALDLAARIEGEEQGRVRATIHQRWQRKSGMHANIRVLLIPGQRQTVIGHAGQWESLKLAWKQIV